MPRDSQQNRREKIASLLGNYSADDRVLWLLGLSVGRILLRDASVDPEKAVRERDAQLRHVADWLAAAVASGDEWLSNTDTLGRPKKMMKFGDIDDIGREADKAMRKALSRLGNVELDPKHETLHRELSDGFVVVRMHSPEALDSESARMQHCIGLGNYDDQLKTGESIFLSIRDRHNNPHVTIEVSAKRRAITQLSGKQNAMAVDRYLPHIRELVVAEDLMYDRASDVLGMVQGRDGVWHDLTDLPSRLETMGAFDLAKVKDEVRMPDELIVNGSFYPPAWLRQLPAKTEIRGDYARAEQDILPVIPAMFKVGGNMMIDGSRYAGAKLPEHLDVGVLSLTSDGNRNVVPKKFSVTGDLWLFVDSAKAVPEELVVDGELTVYSKCRSWPGTVKAGNIVFTAEQPLVVKGHVLADGNLVVGGRQVVFAGGLEVYGDVDMRTPDGDERRTSLPPRDAVIMGSLDLTGSEVGRLPTGLRVDGNLILTDAAVDDISGLKKLGGGLYIENTAIRALPATMKKVAFLNAAISKLSSLPDGFTCGDNLILNGVTMERLPPGLVVKRHLFASNTDLELPDDAVVHGNIVGIHDPRDRSLRERTRPRRSLSR